MGVGVVLGALAYVRQVAQLQIEELQKIPQDLNDPKENGLLEELKDKVSIFSFGGPLSFGAAADLGHRVRERVQPGSKFTILDFSRVPLMDVSAAMAVDTVTSDALAAGRQLIICGANENLNKVLEGVNEAHPGIPNFETLHDALLYAKKKVGGSDDGEPSLQAATQS